MVFYIQLVNQKLCNGLKFFFVMFEHDIDFSSTKEGFFESALICPWSF